MLKSGQLVEKKQEKSFQYLVNKSRKLRKLLRKRTSKLAEHLSKKKTIFDTQSFCNE